MIAQSEVKPIIQIYGACRMSSFSPKTTTKTTLASQQEQSQNESSKVRNHSWKLAEGVLLPPRK